jgi:hypothetical protein
LIYFFLKKKDAGRGKKGSHGSTSITHGQEQQTNNSLEELSCCWQKRGGAGLFGYLGIGRRWKLIDGQTCST